MNNHAIPEGSRPVARVLLLGPDRRLLLLHAIHATEDHKFWLTPGGGLEGEENFEEAARREVREETGIEIEIGPWVWTRRHVYTWNGRSCDQYERFFIARTDQYGIHPVRRDDYVIGDRWWSLEEIRTSREAFVPRRLAEPSDSIVRGEYPDPPIDCGV